MARWTISSAATAPVPPERIFAFYLDPDTWGSWGHNTRWGRARGPVIEGSIVLYTRLLEREIRRLIALAWQPDRFVAST